MNLEFFYSEEEASEEEKLNTNSENEKREPTDTEENTISSDHHSHTDVEPTPATASQQPDVEQTEAEGTPSDISSNPPEEQPHPTSSSESAEEKEEEISITEDNVNDKVKLFSQILSFEYLEKNGVKKTTELSKALHFYFRKITDNAKEKYLSEEEGRDERDFVYNDPLHTQFRELQQEFRKNKTQHISSFKTQLSVNLAKSKELIEKLKELVDTMPELMMNDRRRVFMTHKEILTEWKTVRKLPLDQRDDIYQTFQHHLNRFEELLSYNQAWYQSFKEKNLETKKELLSLLQELAAKAQTAELTEESVTEYLRLKRALTIQWKEAGAIPSENTDEINEQYEAVMQLLSALHEFKKEIRTQRIEEVSKEKKEILRGLQKAIEQTKDEQNPSVWAKASKDVRTYTTSFFENLHVLPSSLINEIKAEFRGLQKQFNSERRVFLAKQKTLEKENLEKKEALSKEVKQIVDQERTSFEQWRTDAEKVKKMQRDFFEIGFVPLDKKKEVNATFRELCNSFFAKRKEFSKQKDEDLTKNYQRKKAILETLEKTTVESLKEKSETESQDWLDSLMDEWRDVGRCPRKYESIENDFWKLVTQKSKEFGIDIEVLRSLKFKTKISSLIKGEREDLIQREERTLRRELDETTREYERAVRNQRMFSSSQKSIALESTFQKQLDSKQRRITDLKSKLSMLRSMRKEVNRPKQDDQSKDE